MLFRQTINSLETDYPSKFRKDDFPLRYFPGGTTILRFHQTPSHPFYTRFLHIQTQTLPSHPFRSFHPFLTYSDSDQCFCLFACLHTCPDSSFSDCPFCFVPCLIFLFCQLFALILACLAKSLSYPCSYCLSISPSLFYTFLLPGTCLILFIFMP